MTEHEARERFVNELLRHGRLCSDLGHEHGIINDSLNRIMDAEHKWYVIRFVNRLERWGDQAPEIAKLSAELTQSLGG